MIGDTSMRDQEWEIAATGKRLAWMLTVGRLARLIAVVALTVVAFLVGRWIGR